MKKYKVTYESVYEVGVVIMSGEDLLEEVNSDRSHEWTDYTLDDLEKYPNEVFGWFYGAEKIEIIY